MNKHPLSYKSEDFKKILFKQIKIVVGKPNNNLTDTTFEGEITFVKPATNPPHLPMYFDFKIKNSEIVKRFDIIETKEILE
jgi:hypothetical protein